MYTIPVLDFRHYIASKNENERLHFVKQLGDALKSKGFFALTNHNVDLDLIRTAYKKAEELFKLPTEQKKEFEDRNQGGQRGYTSFGREHAKNSDTPDLKEFWHVGPNLSASRLADLNYLPNQSPEKYIPHFQKIFGELYKQLDHCSSLLLSACSEYLGEKIPTLADMAIEGNSILRIIHYPPLKETGAIPGGIRSAAHEDINLITLLVAATASGLEILDQESQQWVSVVVPESCIIVDSGDMLQNITNGYFCSTTHRVVNPSSYDERRYSMPFFVHPRSEVSLAPIPKYVDLKPSTKIFPNITAGNYLKQRLIEIGLRA